MRHIIYKLIFFLSLMSYSLLGQQSIIDQKKIVKFNSEMQDKEVVEYLSLYYPQAKITRVSPFLDYYAIEEFSKFPLSLNRAVALNLFDQDKNIEFNFNNFMLKKRSTPTTPPNDPELSNQYNLELTNTYDAWDITTGGKVMDGDSIVIAVYDGGFDLSYKDFSPEIWWKNKAEIPNNGVDDDENGYIDDNLGLTDEGESHISNDIDDNIHGTAVAGIIGAQTNNNYLLSGMLWKPKLLLVSNIRTNDVINWLEGIGYIYEQRRLYNETNGEKGALIVAYNMSWGWEVDSLESDGALMFTDLIDLMGSVGIITVGATANLNTDYDKKFNGVPVSTPDLPTNCPSDYLIVTTASDQNDEKVISAGFGIESVDIAAPAFRIPVLDTANSIKYTSGTSFAAPQISATLALMYSVPVSGIQSKILSDPAAIALKMKTIILETVDPSNDLKDKVRYGGRLNVYKAVSKAQDYFKVVNVNNISTIDAKIQQSTNRIDISLSNKYKKGQFLLIDALGRILLKNEFNSSQFSIETTELSTGIYFIQILARNEKGLVKFYTTR